MAPDATLVDAPPTELPAGAARPMPVTTRAGTTPSCGRFAWGAAGAGLVLFLAALLGATGSWALGTGAVSLTVASVAGVIAMEGCEERVPRSSRPGLGPARTR